MKIEVRKSVVVFDRTERLISSILRDAFSTAMLILCVYVSRDSTWWTFFSALVFLCYMGMKALSVYNERSVKFNNWHELRNWIDRQIEAERKE